MMCRAYDGRQFTPYVSRASNTSARALPPRGLLDVGWEVRDLLHLTHLDDVAIQHRCPLGPFDRLGPGLHLDHPVAAEHFFRFGERPVGHLGRLAAGEADAGALDRRVQPVDPEQHPPLREGDVALWPTGG